MKAYLISIGDELMIGQTINTNAAFIASKLNDVQIEISKTTMVGDNEADILFEFKNAYDSSDLIIVTGGLGPTHDDITRKCVVDFFETELVRDEGVLEDVRNLFKNRGREITKINEDQSLVPKIATVIRNSKGTAPGTWIAKDGKIFISMPGVPYEMEGMMEDFVLPELKSKYNLDKQSRIIVNFLTTGIPESILYERLGDLDQLLQGNKLAFLPNQFGVKMRLTVLGETHEAAQNKLSEIEQKIRSLVGRYIYGKGDLKIEGVIARLLIDRGLKIATAESCTGGLLANRFTNINGSSNFFEKGMVTYSNAAKVEDLSVSEDLIQEKGAVSLEVARQMAEGIKAVSGVDIGIGVTGIMGPTGGTENKPVGLVYIGLCDEKVCTAKEFRFGDDRLLNKDRATQAAIEMLRRHLLGIPYDE